MCCLCIYICGWWACVHLCYRGKKKPIHSQRSSTLSSFAIPLGDVGRRRQSSCYWQSPAFSHISLFSFFPLFPIRPLVLFYTVQQNGYGPNKQNKKSNRVSCIYKYIYGLCITRHGSFSEILSCISIKTSGRAFCRLFVIVSLFARSMFRLTGRLEQQLLSVVVVQDTSDMLMLENSRSLLFVSFLIAFSNL